MKFRGQMLAAMGVFALGILVLANAAGAAALQSETAKAYYKAAAQGSADAQANLADLYAAGTDVEQSDGAAFQWYMRAAGQGHGRAQLKLAEIWSSGRGVPRNDLLAYKWAYLAAQHAAEKDVRDSAEKLLGTLANRLSAAEIGEAREYAAQWKPQLESSPASPSETVASKEPAPKVLQTEPARPAAAGKPGGWRAIANARRARAVAHARAMRGRLISLAHQWGW